MPPVCASSSTRMMAGTTGSAGEVSLEVEVVGRGDASADRATRQA